MFVKNYLGKRTTRIKHMSHPRIFNLLKYYCGKDHERKYFNINYIATIQIYKLTEYRTKFTTNIIMNDSLFDMLKKHHENYQ